jgi:hypothetical protein
MSDKWTLKVFNGDGSLWDRIDGDEVDLREQGVGFTTNKGQLLWRFSLLKNGEAVAMCKRGRWMEIKP